MGLRESVIKNVFCDIVKPRIGSVVKVDLGGKDVLQALFGTRSGCHTGIYIGNNEIVEWANIDGTATVRIVSAEEFIEGDDCISRTGLFIYVACKQDRDGNCIAMGSKDIAVRARAAVGQTSEYSLFFNNCHMFTQYCITGKKSDCSPFLSGVEVALDNKFIEHGYERLLDMWRSTGESRGSNPCFVDDDDLWKFEDNLAAARKGDMEAQFQVAENYYYGHDVDENEAEAVKWYKKAALQGHVESMKKLGQIYYIGGNGVPEDDAESQKWYNMAEAVEKSNEIKSLTIDSSYEEIQKAISTKREELMQMGTKTIADSLVELGNLYSDKMKREIAQKIEEIETKKIKQTAEKMTINDEIEATPENIVIMLNKMAEGDEEFVLISADEDGNSFIQSCPNEDEETYILEYRKDDKLYGTVCKKLESVQEAMEKFCLNDFSFVNKYKWALVDLE